ncbi:hypothetical protein B0H13DRAFT_1921930 [Mycena leptocephala]|nr:hypothetical protein B0H13DRAFT_1921930 [Mycena leptocephala]
MVAGQDRWTRGSAFQGFDAYVGATTVTLLNIGNGGVPKNTNGHLGAQIFVGSGGSLVCLSLLASALLSQVSTTSIFACVCLFGSTSLPTFTFDLGRDFMLYVWYVCGLLPRDVKCALHRGAQTADILHIQLGWKS